MGGIERSSEPGVERVPRSGVRGFRADKLRELRERAGLNPDDLAARIGATRQAVSTWETGRSTPTPPMLARLAQALEVAIVVLVSIPPNRRDLRDLRVLAGLNQVLVAEWLGVSPTTVADLEKGRKAVDASHAAKLASLYSASPEAVHEAWQRTNDARGTRARNL